MPDGAAEDVGEIDQPNFGSVMAACGSSSHDDPLRPDQLEKVLADVHPVVVAQFVRRWANARGELGGSSAEHPDFRETIDRVLSERPHGYGGDETDE